MEIEGIVYPPEDKKVFDEHVKAYEPLQQKIKADIHKITRPQRMHGFADCMNVIFDDLFKDDVKADIIQFPNGK